MSVPAELAPARFRALLAPLLVVMLVTAACSSNSEDPADTTSAPTSDAPAETTTSAQPASSGSTEQEPEPAPTTEAAGPTNEIVVVDPELVIAPDEAWLKQEESFFVWGVEPDDVLNVRSGPGQNQSLVATISPGSGGLGVFDVIERVGNTNWVVVEIAEDGGVGWVADRFLRPEPPAGSPVISGDANQEVLDIVDSAIEGLADVAALGELIGSEGLTVAPFTFIGDETLTLTADEVLNSAETERTWGFQTGSGDPITSSLTEYLDALAGRAALTSTAEIGYDEFIGGGNTINNLDDVFPGATIVEYHHPGTGFYGGLDWTSVRFVFVDEDGSLVLRALVSDQWEI